MTARRQPPASMPAAVYCGPAEVAVEDRPVPRPGPGQALVEVSYCGVCGTDLHMIADGWGRPGTVFGHEYSGVVAAIGDGVVGWAVGDEVVGGPTPRCGACRRCREGQPAQCEDRSDVADGHDGAFARYVLVDARALVRVPDGVGARDAALAEPLAVALHGLTRAQFRLEAGFHQLRRGGRLVMVGAGVEPPAFDPNRMLLNELTVCGSFVYDEDGFDRALELLAAGAVPTDLLVEPDAVPLDRLGHAIGGLAGGTIAGKVMVVPRRAAVAPDEQEVR
jgi:threonine dehydrogenase-like Zn-dependent dehydrogenase